ncbi:MAG: hypothetical protein ONB06_07260, partial [candidate division KSB1 bacterium]|nr:hypothetical protein [candidate division KSB1 bacterium]
KVTLKWNDVTCETKYQVTVENAATNRTVFKKTLAANVTQVKTKALARGQTYRWFVKACNSFGCAKSAKRTFKVQ